MYSALRPSLNYLPTAGFPVGFGMSENNPIASLCALAIYRASGTMGRIQDNIANDVSPGGTIGEYTTAGATVNPSLEIGRAHV